MGFIVVFLNNMYFVKEIMFCIVNIFVSLMKIEKGVIVLNLRDCLYKNRI